MVLKGLIEAHARKNIGFVNVLSKARVLYCRADEVSTFVESSSSVENDEHIGRET